MDYISTIDIGILQPIVLFMDFLFLDKAHELLVCFGRFKYKYKKHNTSVNYMRQVII